MEYQRLSDLSKRYFGDLSELARAMGKHEKTFYPYKNGGFGRKMLDELETFGISKKFLSGVSEQPFANNEAGRALQQKFGVQAQPKKPAKSSYLTMLSLLQQLALEITIINHPTDGTFQIIAKMPPLKNLDGEMG